MSKKRVLLVPESLWVEIERIAAELELTPIETARTILKAGLLVYHIDNEEGKELIIRDAEGEVGLTFSSTDDPLPGAFADFKR